MNWLLIVLLAANLLTFLWLSLQQEPQHTTVRLQTDVLTPEGVRTIWLLSERDSTAQVTRDVSPAKQTQEGVVSSGHEASLVQLDPETVTAGQEIAEQLDKAAETDTMALQGADVALTDTPLHSVDVCQTVGPFKDRTATDPIVSWLKEHGREESVRTGMMNVRIGYWVYLESMSAADARQTVQELKDKGVKDYNQNAQNEISLGIYVKQTIAIRRQKNMEALGYTPLVKPLYRNRLRYWVDVRETETDMLSAQEWDLHLANTPDSRRESMACP